MPTWVTRRIVDLFGRLADLYYSRKYGTMARQLGRPAVAPDDQPGFILIQIDGLSYEHLMEALEAGHMPYLKRLLSRGDLSVASWRCGLPSSTPAVQAGMMFGNRFDIPGYRWYEKDREITINPQRLDRLHGVYDRISEGRVGILNGGSCYVSLFDGGADLALFTLSAVRRERFFGRVRGIGLLGLFLLSPFRSLRLLWRAVVGYLSSLGRRLIALMEPLRKPRAERGVLNPLDVFSPLLYATGDALFTELQTFGVMLDIYRRVAAIFTNYNGYDHVAHKLGLDHRAAYRVLRALDKRIRQIDRMRSHHREREYDLYVISDHGNTPSVPFSRENGATLGEYIIAAVGEGLSLDERTDPHTHLQNTARLLHQELQAMEETTSPRFRQLIAPARRFVRQRLREGTDIDYDLERQRDVVVSASGSLAHVYFNVSPRPLEMIEVVLLYPKLLERLSKSTGIGIVAGRAGESTIVLGSKGGRLHIEDEVEVLEEPNPLAAFGDEAYVAKQVHQLAHFPHSGDLIVLGEVREDGKVITFEHQLSTHGGAGGPQGRPFIAWPPERPLAPATLNDPEDLYDHFMHLYQPQQLDVEGDSLADSGSPCDGRSRDREPPPGPLG